MKVVNVPENPSSFFLVAENDGDLLFVHAIKKHGGDAIFVPAFVGGDELKRVWDVMHMDSVAESVALKMMGRQSDGCSRHHEETLPCGICASEESDQASRTVEMEVRIRCDCKNDPDPACLCRRARRPKVVTGSGS